MDKSDFISAFPQEDSFKLAKLHGFLEKALDLPFFSYMEEFYTKDIWQKVSMMKAYGEISILGEEDFERKIFAKGQGPCPMVVVLMENLNPQKELRHKDYLGGIMSLGITREKFGDVFVEKDRAYVVTFLAMAEHLERELVQVGSSEIAVTIKPYEVVLEHLKPTFIFTEVIVSSLRLDVLVAEIARCSRKNAVDTIKRGLVLLNYVESKEKAKELKVGDTLTIRGQGKYKIGEVLGTTKKENFRIRLKQFI